MRALHLLRACVLALALSGGEWAWAECAALHDSLDSPMAIAAAGGAVTGALTFPSAVNGASAAFDGADQVSYTDARFAATAGSISLWVRRNGPSTSGGIAEIGTIGQPTSLGLFYVNGTDLIFEMRSDASELTATYAPGALSDSDWTHVVLSWRDQPEGGTVLWLFVNGRYVSGNVLPSSSTRTATTLRIGATGFYGNGRVVIDELRFFEWNLHDSEVYAEYVISANRHNPQPPAKPVSTGPVRVVDGKLIVEGRPFTVRGVGYSPVPIGWEADQTTVNFMYSNPSILGRDSALIRAMHANTIRTWVPPPNSLLLDVMYHGGVDPIYTILGFWLPHDGVDYANPVETAPLEAQFTAFVNAFKDHPGLLAWGVGNEVNLALSDAEAPAFFAFADKLAELAYNLEGPDYHPTVIVNAYMLLLGNMDAGSDDGSLPHVDLWGQNLYFGNDGRCIFDYYNRITSKPQIVTEFGIDARDHRIGAEYESVQAAYDVRQWRFIEPNTLGGVVFEYCDEWWKAGDPTTQGDGGYATHWHPDGFSDEEWYGIVEMADAGSAPDTALPRPAYYALAEEYAHAPGDYDADGDADLRDFAALQRCIGQPATGACGAAFEWQVDGIIDVVDAIGIFSFWNSPY